MHKPSFYVLYHCRRRLCHVNILYFQYLNLHWLFVDVLLCGHLKSLRSTSVCMCKCVHMYVKCSCVHLCSVWGYVGPLTHTHTRVYPRCAGSLWWPVNRSTRGQRRRLTEAIPQPAVTVISLWGQRLSHPVEHECREVNTSVTPERRHLSVLQLVSISMCLYVYTHIGMECKDTWVITYWCKKSKSKSSRVC